MLMLFAWIDLQFVLNTLTQLPLDVINFVHVNLVDRKMGLDEVTNPVCSLKHARMIFVQHSYIFLNIFGFGIKTPINLYPPSIIKIFR
jgi:hypothetical protein